jgi:hypothetical protein
MKGIHFLLNYRIWKDRIDIDHLKARLSSIPINKLLRKARGYCEAQGGDVVGLFADAAVKENNKKLAKTSTKFLPPRGISEI